jgi:hypothetical protein
MFPSFAVFSALSVWSERPVAERSKALRTYLTTLVHKPQILAAIGEALPEPVRKPFQDFVDACEVQFKG